MFCEDVIRLVLAPHWDNTRTGFVEEVDSSAGASPKTNANAEGAEFIQLAEELIVTRYVALIRAVLD